MSKFPVRTLTEFGKEVKISLIRKSMTQEDLAELLGISSYYLRDILYGARAGISVREKICETLGIENHDKFVGREVSGMEAEWEMPLLENDNTYRSYAEQTYPIAEEIVKFLADKKISYAEAYEALDIAKEGIKTLIFKRNL